MSALQEHRNAWKGKSDEWLFERLNNELKGKVEEIHRLLNVESDLTKQIEEQQKEIEKLKRTIELCSGSCNINFTSNNKCGIFTSSNTALNCDNCGKHKSEHFC